MDICRVDHADLALLAEVAHVERFVQNHDAAVGEGGVVVVAVGVGVM